MNMEDTPHVADSEQETVSRFKPIKLKGGEPTHIAIMRERGHGSEHPQIAKWEASQNNSEESAIEETPA